jgi:hypothetical protein
MLAWMQIKAWRSAFKVMLVLLVALRRCPVQSPGVTLPVSSYLSGALSRAFMNDDCGCDTITCF